MAADTKERILEAARLTVQDIGYSGLSFRELAKEVGIKSASIHYYYETKGELGAELVCRYTAHYSAYLKKVFAEERDLKTCMARYTEVFADTLRNANRLCLAGMLAAEHNEIPAEIRAEVVRWGDMNEAWVARVLARDAASAPEDHRPRARAIFAAISGAQLVAHSRNDVAVYNELIATYRASGLIP